MARAAKAKPKAQPAVAASSASLRAPWQVTGDSAMQHPLARPRGKPMSTYERTRLVALVVNQLERLSRYVLTSVAQLWKAGHTGKLS